MTFPFIVGLGSHHGDDQAGWLVLERLRERHFPLTQMMRLQHPVDLLDVSNVEQSLIICDACCGSGDPGSIHLFRWPSDQLSYQRASGSHDLSLCSVMELGQQLGCFPKTADIWALEVEACSAGSEPSNPVRCAAMRLADRIWESHCHA